MKNQLRNIFHIDHIIVAAFTILIIELLVIVAVNLDFLSPVVRALESFSMTDVYYKIQNKSEEIEECNTITLVDMTDLTHRQDIAKVINEIKALKPTALGIDIIFEGQILDGDGDDMLAEACLDGDSTNTVWAYKLTQYNEDTRRFQNSLHSFFIVEGMEKEGFVNLMDDPTKTIKRYAVTLPYKETVAYSLPAQIARIVKPIDLGDERSHTINYKPVSFPVVTYNDLSSFRELIQGHIVLLGTTQEEREKYYTPIGQKSGLEIMAYTILSMTESIPIRHSNQWMVILWALIAGAITNIIDYLLTKRIANRHSTLMVFITQSEFYDRIISFFVMILITGASFELYVKYNYFVDTVLALTTIVLIEEGRLLYVGLLSVLKKKTNWKWVKRSIYASDLE
jgi:CHASE2 domain-containing sensor protein